ncbi:MAG: 30S ribosomal protein S1 [Desulfovibrio sp.]|nr:30S ribosomal protein S1 [Desulfovibrio sp.]
MTEEKFAASMQEEGVEDFAAMLAAHETTGHRLQTGQKVTGTVIAVTGDSVFIDVGIKVDGIMERKDILDAEGKETAGPGDTVEAWVVGVSSQEIRLSRSMSGSGVAALEDARDTAIPVDGRIAGTCKGGYTVEVMGKTAFCPGSQIGLTAGEEAESLVGRTLQFIVIRVENRGRNIVVSHRALLDRERHAQLEVLLEKLTVGATVEGKISRFAPFGAFMELDTAVEGMILLSEHSWSRVGAPDEAVSLGDTVRAKVLSISKNDKGQVRISLSRKQAEGDPWQDVDQKLEAGSVVQGKVVRLAPFGVFIEILPGIEGLAHISELSWTKRVTKPEEIVQAGDTVAVKIKDISSATRRISLSLREAEGDPWQDAAQRFAAGSLVQGTVDGRSPHGLFITLAPGITGLLPAGVIKNSKNSGQYSKLDKGDSVALIVQNIDTALRRISLAPEGTEASPAADDKAWKQHANLSGNSGNTGINTLAQALHKAMQNK